MTDDTMSETAKALWNLRVASREDKYKNFAKYCDVDLLLTYEKDWLSVNVCWKAYVNDMQIALDYVTGILWTYDTDASNELRTYEEITNTKKYFQDLYSEILKRDNPKKLGEVLWYELIRLKIEQTIGVMEVAETYFMTDKELEIINQQINENLRKSLNFNSLDIAIEFAYRQELTKYDNQNSYRPYDKITREQFAKFIVTYTNNNYTTNKWPTCYFTDITNADPTLVSFIYEWCELGIMKWGNQKFRPFDNITTLEVIVTLLRLKYGNIDSSVGNRYDNYLPYIYQHKLLDNISSWLYEPISRWDAAKLFYKFYYSVD